MCDGCCDEHIDIQKDIFSTIRNNLKVIKDFQPHTTNFGKYLKEFIVHHALYDSIILLGINIYHIFQIVSSDPSDARTANAVFQLVLSSIYLSYAIFDKVQHSHHQIRYVHGEAEESNKTKLRRKIVDIMRMFLLDTIFYARLMLTMFVYIEEHVRDDISFVTWLNFFLTIKSKILYAYITPAVVIGEKAWSKLTKGEKKPFHICSGVKIYGQKVIQLVLILAIGLTYHTEYSNGYNKEYEAHINQTFKYNFLPSGQLWYMIFTGYFAPILGLIVFVILLLHIYDMAKEEMERIVKLIYLVISPYYIIPFVLYATILTVFGLCTVINGVGGPWIALYVLGPLLVLAVNLPAPILWVLLKPGKETSEEAPEEAPDGEEATDQENILLKEVANDD